MRILLRDLSPGTIYHLQARVLDENIASEWSRKFTLETSTDTVPPAAPANPVIVMSGSEAALSWNPVTQNDDGTPIRDLSSYRVTVKSPSTSGSFVKDVGLATNMEFSLDTNRNAFGTPRGQLFFEVVAIDAIGNVSEPATSSIVSTPPPANVTGLEASPDQSAINLKWDLITNPIITGYRVYMGTTEGFTPTTPVAEVNANVVSIPTTLYGTDLYFKVVAVDVFGITSAVPASAGPVRPTSPFAIDTTPPAVPTGLTAVINNNVMKVSWTAVADTDMRGYVVSYRATGTSDWSNVSVPYDQTTTAINVIPGVNYNVRVLARDMLSNTSNWSAIVTTNTATVNTAPAVPTGLSVIAGRDDLQIKWNENTEDDMKNNVGTYDVTVATNSGFTTGVLQYKTGALTLSVNGLATSTQYWVRVRATDSGTPPLSSAYSSSVTATTGAFPVTALSDGNAPASSPVATATGGFGYIHASWTPITNNDMVTYEVHLGTTTGFVPSGSTKVSEIAGSTTIIENTASGAALAYGTNYYVKIIAKDRDGAASPSAASSAVQITKVAATDTTIQPVDIGAATQSDLNTKFNATIKNSVVEYAVNSSESTAPTSGWSTATPTRTAGSFIWYRTVLTFGDNTTSTSSPALLTGNTGATGTAGTPAPVVSLTATTQVLTSPAGGGATSPATAVVTGTATNTTITSWTYSSNGAAFTATLPAGVTRSGNVVTITGSTVTAKTITVRMADADGNADTLTVAKVFDGATGATGTPGTPGADGATGPAGADAYTVILTNESQTFAGSTTAALAGSTTSGVIAYKGGTQIAATIGTITGQVTGLTTAISNNGTTNASVTVTVTTALTTKSGELTIPVTVDGKSFTKKFSWALSLQGATGSQGIQGPPGANGQSLYTWLKYADTPTTGMSDSPTGKAYIGLAYNKTSSTESSTYSDYTWSLVKGEQGNQGVQGPAGADGATTYTWVKYADNASGGGMSDSPAGKTYIGLAFNKTTATESTTTTDYQWSLIQGPQGAQGPQGNTGPAGADAKVISLTATTQVLTSPATGGTTNPATSVVTGEAVNTTITAWTYSVNGAAFSTTVPAGVSRSGNTVTITGSTMTAKTVAVKMADAAGNSDTLTVAKVLDGAKGDTGNTGGTGATGAAGADAYTVILSNEAHAFAGSTNAALASSTTSNVIAYKGATQVAATVGTITGQVTGLTTSIASNGTTAPVITVTATTALTTRNGTLTVPVTVDGKTFTKTIAWSVAYTGATGNTGSPGAAGVSVTSVTPYFQQVNAGAAAPAAPTTSTPPAPWTTTEPAFSISKDLYRTERIGYSNSTFAYTTVTKVSSVDAARQVANDLLNNYTTATDVTAAINTAKTQAISTAQTTAEGLANDALSDAQSYTDGQKSSWLTTAASTAQDKADLAQANAIQAASDEVDALRAQALAAAANSANLVVNPSFEAGLEGWSISGAGALKTTGGKSGSNFIELSGAANVYSSSIPVVEGQTYKASIWGRAAGTLSATTNIVIEYSSNGGSTWSNRTSVPEGRLSTANTSWTQLRDAEYTIPAGVTHIRLRVASNHTGAGTSQIDDAVVNDITESKRLEQLANDVESRALSRGTDLVTNGTGYMGTNYNFSSFTFDPSDAPTGANGSFTHASNAYGGGRLGDEFIPIDLSKRYIVAGWGREQAAGKTSRAYLGLAPYDGAGSGISPVHYAHLGSTTTTLAADLKPGDTTVSLTSGANWSAVSPNNYLGIWNYVDGFGKLWPVGTYTRNVYTFNAVNGNTLALNTTYTGPVVPAGTSVSNMNSGGSYMYVTMTNALLTNTWTRHASIPIGGLHDGSNRTVATTSFPPGTASVRLLFLPNYSPGTAGSSQAFAGISISDAQAASYYANNITETQITDNAITTPKIATNAVDARIIKSDAVEATHIKAGAVIAGKLAANSVISENIVTDAVDARTIKADAVGAVAIAANSIIAEKIATGAIESDKIKAGAVGATAIAAESINATHIKASSITGDKLLIGDTRNHFKYAVGNGTPTPVVGNTLIQFSGSPSYAKRQNTASTAFTLGDGTDVIPTGTQKLALSGILLGTTGTAANSFPYTVILNFRFNAGGAWNQYPLGGGTITPTNPAPVSASVNLSGAFYGAEYYISIESSYFNGSEVTFQNGKITAVTTSLIIEGDALVNGTITADKIKVGAITADKFATSTMTSTVITIGTGGIIKTATGGVQITDSGIIIPSGHLDANVLKANTSFITTLNVGAGGSIQSTGYTSGGTSGFSLSSSGLTIKGTNNTVDGGTIPTSTLDVNSIKTSSLTATTISLGANGNISVGVGGKITVDGSTGSIQSNNYSGTTTGWGLGPSGLIINEGSIDAKALRTDSAIVADLTIGQSANTLGSIKSFGYVANTTGFKLDKTGLEINNGSISAEALRLQIGRNQMHPAYADFEYEESFYVGKIANFFAIPMVSSEQAKFGSKSLKIAWTGVTGAAVVFAPTETSWNVRFDPSKPQIVSMWIYQPDAYALQMVVKVNRSSGGPIDVASPSVSVGTGWQRIEFEWTPPALATGDAVVMLRSAGASSGKTMYVDAIQFEERTGAAGSGASTYFPPSTTTIDGGAINTGSIRSSALNSRSEPFWSINTSGNAVFNRALIQEELIVGDPSDGAKFASIKSVNYQPGTSGWQVSSTGLIEMNDGIFRGRVVSGDPNGQRAEQSVDGFKVWLIDPSRPEMAPWAATSITTGNISIGIMGSDGTKIAGISPDGVVTGVTSSYLNDIRIKGLPLVGNFGGSTLPGWLDNLPRGVIAYRSSGTSDTSGSAKATNTEIMSYTLVAQLLPGRRYRVVAEGRFRGNVANGNIILRIRAEVGNTKPTTSSPQVGMGSDRNMVTTGHTPTIREEGFYEVSVATRVTFRMSFHGLYNATPIRYGHVMYVEDVGPTTPLVAGGEDVGDSTVGYVTTWRASATRMYRHTGAYITNQEGQVNQWHWVSPVAHEQAGILFAGNAIESTDASEMNRTIASVLNGATILKVEVYLRNKSWYANEHGRVVMNSLGATSLPTSKIIDASLDLGDLPAGEGRWFEVTKTWFTNGTSQSNLGVTLGDKDGNYASKSLVPGIFHGINDTDPPLLRITYSRPS